MCENNKWMLIMQKKLKHSRSLMHSTNIFYWSLYISLKLSFSHFLENQTCDTLHCVPPLNDATDALVVHEFYARRTFVVFRNNKFNRSCDIHGIFRNNHAISKDKAFMGTNIYHMGSHHPIHSDFSSLVSTCICELLRLSDSDALHWIRMGIFNYSFVS